MNETPSNSYTLEALEGATGVTARTIRYYISQGLIPPPFTVGRTASYGEVHLVALKRVATLKAQGMSLEAIKQTQQPKNPEPGLPFQQWDVVQPAEDVAVFVKSGLTPRRRKQIEKALVPFVAAVTRTQSEEG